MNKKTTLILGLVAVFVSQIGSAQNREVLRKPQACGAESVTRAWLKQQKTKGGIQWPSIADINGDGRCDVILGLEPSEAERMEDREIKFAVQKGKGMHFLADSIYGCSASAQWHVYAGNQSKVPYLLSISTCREPYVVRYDAKSNNVIGSGISKEQTRQVLRFHIGQEFLVLKSLLDAGEKQTANNRVDELDEILHENPYLFVMRSVLSHVDKAYAQAMFYLDQALTNDMVHQQTNSLFALTPSDRQGLDFFRGVLLEAMSSDSVQRQSYQDLREKNASLYGGPAVATKTIDFKQAALSEYKKVIEMIPNSKLAGEAKQRAQSIEKVGSYTPISGQDLLNRLAFVGQ